MSVGVLGTAGVAARESSVHTMLRLVHTVLALPGAQRRAGWGRPDPPHRWELSHKKNSTP